MVCKMQPDCLFSVLTLLIFDSSGIILFPMLMRWEVKNWLIVIFSVVFLIPIMLVTGTFIYEYRHVYTKTLNIVEISGIPVASKLPVRASAMFEKSRLSRCLQYSIKVREFKYSKWWICVIPEERKTYITCSYIGLISVFHHTFIIMDQTAETALLSKLEMIAPGKTIL